MNSVSVLGMGMSFDDLTKKHLDIIKNAEIIIGGRRHLDNLENSGLLNNTVQKKQITADISGLVSYVGEALDNGKKVVTLASGDPLFFGIGTTLIKHLGEDNVNIYPNITSVGAAFAKIKEQWEDAAVLSLHGKNKPDDLRAVLEKNIKIAVFTDPVKNPSWLSQKLIDGGFNDFRICVLEQIGTDNENTGWYDLEDAVNKQFSDPNIVILKKEIQPVEAPVKSLRSGSPDEYFAHQKGLITKSEIRAVTLSKLDLNKESVLWDLGAGSGSVSVEASIFIKSGKIIAVEKNKDRITDIEENKKRFNVNNLEILNMEVPEGLGELDEPDRIFIGGGGKNLGEIIKQAAKYLTEKGIIVVNTVILKNIDTALTTLKNEGFKTEIVQMQVSFGHDMPWGEMMKSHNPVWIIKGTR